MRIFQYWFTSQLKARTEVKSIENLIIQIQVLAWQILIKKPLGLNYLQDLGLRQLAQHNYGRLILRAAPKDQLCIFI